ncbi:hypothetical protein ACFL6G_09270 [candidate division KSB1 bacterium]
MKRLKFIAFSIIILSAFMAVTFIKQRDNIDNASVQDKTVNNDNVTTQQGSAKADQDTIRILSDTLETELGTIIITQRTLRTIQGTIIVTLDTIKMKAAAIQEPQSTVSTSNNIKENDAEDRILKIGGREIEIKGSVSFNQIEKLTGVPASFLIKKLKLPSNISKTRNLGNLRRTYGFEMRDVRKYIREYLK